MTVLERECHGIMGPNGAGKTTFFNVLTGRAKPTRGELFLGGENVAGLAAAAHRAQGRGALVPDHDLVRRIHRARQCDGGACRNSANAASICAAPRPATAISKPRPRKCWRMSASPTRPTSARRNCPMATAARSRSRWRWRRSRACSASTSRPRASAPTACSACSGSRQKLKGKLTMIVIEHDMSFLFSLADRISVLHWGQVVARGTPMQLQNNPWVKRSNLGKFS